MKNISIILGRIVVAAAICLAVSFLPVIPVLEAPVVPDPSYRSAFASIQQLFGIGVFVLVGIHYQATWATLPVALGVMAAAVFGGWRLSRVLEALLVRKPTSAK
jgi:hypothetical protein